MDSPHISLLDALPLVAILRGVTPDEAAAVGTAIVDAGFRCVEVPLNSPAACESIARLRAAIGERALVGAGTVTSVDEVRQVADAGGQLCVSPNTDADVIRATKDAGMLSLPGFFTPTEAFRALSAGADALKLFPAEALGPRGLAALRAVLPPGTRVYAVGGVDPQNMGEWRSAGASGFGIGSALFRPGEDAAETGRKAQAFVAALQEGGNQGRR